MVQTTHNKPKNSSAMKDAVVFKRVCRPASQVVKSDPTSAATRIEEPETTRAFPQSSNCTKETMRLPVATSVGPKYGAVWTTAATTPHKPAYLTPSARKASHVPTPTSTLLTRSTTRYRRTCASISSITFSVKRFLLYPDAMVRSLRLNRSPDASMKNTRNTTTIICAPASITFFQPAQSTCQKGMGTAAGAGGGEALAGLPVCAMESMSAAARFISVTGCDGLCTNFCSDLEMLLVAAATSSRSACASSRYQ